ncbi:PREDICTED: peroxisome proliferator-activated receptor gamma coactivator-related protein 1-like [Cyprinodon variegatus]|uniref:Peroxisome proliferator-activated receptor gamma coactivator-related protein 1-like n=1 Tax=Cyprinodon variegatus TaxID=28743 RepID=A0A3Q2DDG6_CYPVA|nr:PREDICTED: peroxisome proliferator-activated receptor gamma coactivator-related protein 1-like [Cyprinodon variegatus]
MAARKKGEESDLTVGNGEFPSSNPLNELALSRSHGEEVDRSILALFEDSIVASESHHDPEEGSESLLHALNEMLDRVGQEDDDDEIFSPFDILPNTELLHRAEHRDEPLLQEPSPPVRLRLRPKPPDETAKACSDGEQKVERNGPSQVLKKKNQRSFCAKTKRAKAEVEVFTSTSLVSLVKLMHPYCLKLNVEKAGTNSFLFSQEEVWRYERPSEESDEEINVVSDDEETKEEGFGRREGAPPLKSVLLREKSPREKKRVSFGPVYVASFNESEEDPQEKNLNTKTPEDPPEALPSRGNQSVDHEDQEKKSGTKTKSLSLQEYRQLRLNRKPLVEKNRNNTTKWPTVSELPEGLTPILPLCRPNTTAEYGPLIQHASNVKEARLHNPLQVTKPEPRSSQTPPLPEDTIKPTISKLGSWRAKKPKHLSSDPPNPVLVPLAAPRTPTTPPGSACLHRNKHLQNEFPNAPYLSSSEPSSNASPLNKNLQEMDIQQHQEVKPPHTVTGSHQESSQNPTEPAEQSASPDPPLSPPLTENHVQMKETLPEVESKEPESPGSGCRGSRAAAESGIEAADLTSLLEQFEETQEGNCCVELNRPNPAEPEQPSKSPLKLTVEALKPRITDEILNVRTLDVPEPLRTEVVQSTLKNQTTRSKSPSVKHIQIIDPRPLPSRKARMSLTEPPAAQTSAQMYSHFCSDHDYCGSVGHYPLEDKPPPETRTEPEQMTPDSGADGVHKDQVSDKRTSALLHPLAEGGTGSQINTNTNEVLQFSPSAVTEGGSRDDKGTALCSLPTPPPSPPTRGRSKRRYRRRSPRSDSSSSSCSPKRPRIRRRRSESSSCSSSPSPCASSPRRYRMSYSRSRSSSWSRSRSRSSSPQIYPRRWRDMSISRCGTVSSRRRSRENEMRIQKLKAIDERRVVYVGRIRRTMTHDELRERFSQFGEVECVSLHFRDSGDHYSFVTFYNTEDAFAAIDNGGKLRRPNELPFDLCFGGRRQFCNSDYADLDANREAQPPSPRSRFEDLDFDSLLKQAQRGLKR